MVDLLHWKVRNYQNPIVKAIKIGDLTQVHGDLLSEIEQEVSVILSTGQLRQNKIQYPNKSNFFNNSLISIY